MNIIKIIICSLLLFPLASIAKIVMAEESPRHEIPRIEKHIPVEEREPVKGLQPLSTRIPPGAEDIMVIAGGVIIEGAFAELAGIEEDIFADIIGKSSSLRDIYEGFARVEESYISAGYLLARVIVPPQEIEDGSIIRAIVIDGFIERLDTERVPERLRGFVTRMLSPLLNKKGLKSKEIERRLLLTSRSPGLIQQSTLMPGVEPGGVVMGLEAVHDPYDIEVMYDNSLSRTSGTDQVMSLIRLKNAAGHGESGYLGYITNPGHPERRQIYIGGVQSLLGVSGLSFYGDAVYSKTKAGEPLLPLDINSKYERYGLGLGYPLILRRDGSLTVKGMFYGADDEEHNIGGLVYDDQIRYVHLGLDGYRQWFALGLYAGFDLSYSHGIDGLGAVGWDNGRNQVSRVGADADFRKLELELTLVKSLLPGLRFEARGRLQQSLTKTLYSSEQLNIAGSTSSPLLSGFSAGSLTGDDGYVARAELARTFSGPLLNSVIEPYIFYGEGEVRLDEPAAGEHKSRRASSVGAGTRFNTYSGKGPRAAAPRLSIALEYANARVGNKTKDAESGHNVFVKISAGY